MNKTPKPLPMRTKLLNLFLLLHAFAFSQSFTHSLAVFSPSSGLQALAVMPKLKNISAGNFGDVRLFGGDSVEMPYFLVNESFSYSSTRFKEYEIADRENKKGKYSSFIVVNPGKALMQNIVLCIANSDAVKLCDIAGSDDKEQWFSVSDGIWMHHIYDPNSAEAYRTLIFPPVNYKYIKVVIDDRFTLPYNIKKAGYFEGAIGAGKLNEVKPITFGYSTDKEKKISRALIKFADSTIIDQVVFKIKAPNLFKRQARFYVIRTEKTKGREEQVKVPLYEFELNSDTKNTFNLNDFRYTNFELEIINEDNPPLEIDSVGFFQLQSWLVADFKAGSTYSVFAGNKKLKAPSYDIEHFRNKISQFLPTLAVGDLVTMPVKDVSLINAEAPEFWQQPWFLWSCIALASFLLFLFSIKILRDMKNSGSN